MLHQTICLLLKDVSSRLLSCTPRNNFSCADGCLNPALICWRLDSESKDDLKTPRFPFWPGRQTVSWENCRPDLLWTRNLHLPFVLGCAISIRSDATEYFRLLTKTIQSVRYILETKFLIDTVGLGLYGFQSQTFLELCCCMLFAIIHVVEYWYLAEIIAKSWKKIRMMARVENCSMIPDADLEMMLKLMLERECCLRLISGLWEAHHFMENEQEFTFFYVLFTVLLGGLKGESLLT